MELKKQATNSPCSPVHGKGAVGVQGAPITLPAAGRGEKLAGDRVGAAINTSNADTGREVPSDPK